MPYVERRGGVVFGIFANRQEGYAEEQLPEDHADVGAFRERIEAALRPRLGPLTTEQKLEAIGLTAAELRTLLAPAAPAAR